MRQTAIAILLASVAATAVHAQSDAPAPAPAQTAPKTQPAAPAPSQAQGNQDVRISGTVEKFDGKLISISPSQGITLVVHFDAGPGINSMRKAKPTDVKVGQQVSAQAKSNPAGGFLATQIIIYENGAEQQAGEVPSTDPSQVVARVTDVGTSNDGPVLSLAYKEGERKVTIGKDAILWSARPASAADIKPGALITIAGTKAPEGEVKVVKASIGPAGADNPPL
jgi:hypothetical protein